MSAKEQVLNLLKENSEAMKAGEIAAALSIDKKEVDKAIKELKTDGTDDYSNSILSMIGSTLTSEVSQGVEMAYNVNAKDILSFKSTDGTQVDFIGLLSEIAYNLGSADENDSSKIANENLDDLDKVIQNLLKIRAEVGAKQNRMESAKSKNEDENYNMTDILSKTEDVDFTEKTIQYSVAQTVYQAALQVSAQILPTTLLDYL